MKANEAPEKIYLTPLECMAASCQPQKDNTVEYIRTDAFIEKACKFLNKKIPITNLSSSNMLDITFKVFDKENKRVLIENFKKYIKGE